ncbi:secretion system protein E [Novimethylophilus kurashikiensis]|uniref:Secretion system protein E n=1 Tax=Novimethylophilus kurashikiensis TaxID=1825523 RepID=A0A2R5FCR6_9PROT|nr:hypothetical protein [Novimethylophilus kurashikiensis]GBG14434.1 secretion system protein E [Novimethylophilus kurashikiensis]
MCLQCLTEARVIAADVLPGYSLLQSTADNPDWPKGWFGLVRQNDPDLIFEGPLYADPTAGLDDDAVEEQVESRDFDEFCVAAGRLHQALSSMGAMPGYQLVEACRRQGYNMDRDGHEVAYWLMHHLANTVTHKEVPHGLQN